MNVTVIRNKAVLFVLALFLLPGLLAAPVHAQRDSGVIISGNEATLKTGFRFVKGAGQKVQVVQESGDAAKREAVVAGITEIYCGCHDPKTELFNFCDVVISGNKAVCKAISKCTCKMFGR